jgi:hypothetical protein
VSPHISLQVEYLVANVACEASDMLAIDVVAGIRQSLSMSREIWGVLEFAKDAED